MEPTPSGIRFIEGNELGEALNSSLTTLTNIKLREEQVRQNQEQKLEDALTIATSGMANRDASEINSTLQSFINKTKGIARKYHGQIPFDEWAKIKSEKANIEAMVKKSAADQEQFNQIAKYVSTTGRKYINDKKTKAKLDELMRKGLMERDDLWSAVMPHVDIVQMAKDNVNKFQSGGYEIKGNKVITTKSNQADIQIKNLYATNEDFRDAVKAQWEENPMQYPTPEEYAVGMIKPFVEASTQSVKQWGSRKVGTTKKSTKQYAVEADGTYNFSTSPIILHDISDSAGRSIGTFSISKLREEDGKFIGVGTSTSNFYYNFSDLQNAAKAVKSGKTNQEYVQMAELYDKIPGETAADKQAKYTSSFLDYHDEYENPNKKAGEPMEIELSESDAALVKEKLSGWSKVETPSKKSTKKQASSNNDDPMGIL